jgi:hypothetical protein
MLTLMIIANSSALVDSNLYESCLYSPPKRRLHTGLDPQCTIPCHYHTSGHQAFLHQLFDKGKSRTAHGRNRESQSNFHKGTLGVLACQKKILVCRYLHLEKFAIGERRELIAHIVDGLGEHKELTLTGLRWLTGLWLSSQPKGYVAWLRSCERGC